jgi:recombination protein RecT
MSTASDLRGKVADKAAEVATRQGPPTTIGDLLQSKKTEIALALPKHLDADRLLRTVSTAMRQTPLLAQCSPSSLLGAVMLSAQLGLEPGPLGHCYLLPFKKNTKLPSGEWESHYEVTWILGYKGTIDLAWRSGKLKSIEAREVRQNDSFEYEYGLNPRLVHRPNIREDRGEAYAYYGVAHFKDGGYYFLVMSKSDIEEHRERSKAKDKGPWITDYDAMARKTCIRAMAPFLPLSPDLVQAFANDETVRQGVVTADDVTPPHPAFIEGEAVEDTAPEGVDVETGEIVVDGEVSPAAPADATDPVASPSPVGTEPDPEDGATWPETPAPGSARRRS